MNTTNPTSLKVSVLDKDDLGNWYCAYDISGGGSDIHQLEFSSFGAFDQLFMIVGYNQAIVDTSNNNADSQLTASPRQASNVLHIYSYRSGEIKDLFSQEYSLMKVMDIDNDGYQEIVTIVDSKTGDEPSVNIIEYNAGIFYISQGETVAMDDSVLSYVNVQSGFIGTNQSALYLDGVREMVQQRLNCCFIRMEHCKAHGWKKELLTALIPGKQGICQWTWTAMMSLKFPSCI